MFEFIVIPILLITFIACFFSTLVDSLIQKASDVWKKQQHKKRFEGVERLENRKAFIDTEKI